MPKTTKHYATFSLKREEIKSQSYSKDIEERVTLYQEDLFDTEKEAIESVPLWEERVILPIYSKTDYDWDDDD